jgi:hypothetical protein
MNTHIYTPRLKNTGERLRLRLNDSDWIVANPRTAKEEA